MVEISPLGLVEMTRQNVTDGVREIMTRPCPTCDGEGVIKSEETIAIEFERRMRDLAKETEAEAILIQMNPRVSAEFTRDEARALRAIEEETGKWFHFEGSEGLPLDHFAVVLEASRERVLERAVPFREGEEVHVEIVEPHMYSPGDAVAKVDGYMISITGGGDTWARSTSCGSRRPGGRRRWPRWWTCRRGPRRFDDGSENGDGLESKPRRRGRRGGRRRSSAKAESVAALPNDMYAIVKTGGKQYRVEQGQSLLVERLAVDDGESSAWSRCCSSTAPTWSTADLSDVSVRPGWWPTSAVRSCASSSSSPSAATSAAPATARS